MVEGIGNGLGECGKSDRFCDETVNSQTNTQSSNSVVLFVEVTTMTGMLHSCGWDLILHSNFKPLREGR